jgi:hypothetical protein
MYVNEKKEKNAYRYSKTYQRNVTILSSCSTFHFKESMMRGRMSTSYFLPPPRHARKEEGCREEGPRQEEDGEEGGQEANGQEDGQEGSEEEVSDRK